MATATYPAHKMSAAAKVQLRADGSATVQCAAHDLGTELAGAAGHDRHTILEREQIRHAR